MEETAPIGNYWELWNTVNHGMITYHNRINHLPTGAGFYELVDLETRFQVFMEISHVEKASDSSEIRELVASPFPPGFKLHIPRDVSSMKPSCDTPGRQNPAMQQRLKRQPGGGQISSVYHLCITYILYVFILSIYNYIYIQSKYNLVL